MADDALELFDPTKMDRFMAAAEMDVILTTSKHNIQFMLNGYSYLFFQNFDALGVSRYLPILIYPRGRAAEAVYLGNAQEDSDVENGRIWCPTAETRFWGTTDAANAAVDHLRRLGLDGARIGVERSFMPADAMDILRAGLPKARFVEALLPLERLRAVKTPAELSLIRHVSERVVDAMTATFASACAGMTKQQLVETLKTEETSRGLRFDWCYIAAGSSFNRAPNAQSIKLGDVLSLDSGGSMSGYFGDLCRMGVVGEPDQELQDLLTFIDGIQMRAREPIRGGCRGAAIYDRVRPTLEASRFASLTSFVAHGMGIIGHEAPRLSDQGPVTYPAYDAELPLEAGMVLSIETTLFHPSRGIIKLEDTVVVQEAGSEGFGDGSRGWNVIAG